MGGVLQGGSPLGGESSGGGVLQGQVSSRVSGPGKPQVPLGGDGCLLEGPAGVTRVPTSGAGRTATRLHSLGLGLARVLGFPDWPCPAPGGGPRHGRSPGICMPSLHAIWGRRPGCICLCSRSHSGSLHRHREARGGHGLHAGGCQPLPHVPQRPLHARPGGRAPRERGRGPAVVRGGLVHQSHPREEHAASGESGGAPLRQRQLWTLSPCAGSGCTWPARGSRWAVPAVVCTGGAPRSGQRTARLGAWAV